MPHNSLQDTLKDLKSLGDTHHYLEIEEEVDPYLELAAIARRLYALKGPAVLFKNVRGSKFPVLVNLYGTMERARYLFRHSLSAVSLAVQAKSYPMELLKQPRQWPKLPFIALNSLPRKVSQGAVEYAECTLADLPQIVAWPKDGGAFITLPQVFTREPGQNSVLKSNLGMYRVQISGNQYAPNECGLHYQIHRGIGIHHQKALALQQPLKVSIFVGGPPAHALSAVMPLPEGVPELAFAGVLAGTPFRYSIQESWVISADADFVILGEVLPHTLPEGPFGDHLGYYSLTHDFPALQVHKVLHRKDAIWNATVVGRPPQEDTTFGNLIHEMTGSAVPANLPGIHEVHAVDAAGVHPLLLALGSERYMPYQERRPLELLTQANALLGFGQISLAKYIFLTAREDDAQLSTHHIAEFIQHVLQRVRLQGDLHFQTSTSIDTLDYSGEAMHVGSKLVIAACGDPVRELGQQLHEFPRHEKIQRVQMVMPGVLALQSDSDLTPQELTEHLSHWATREQWPWISWVDDAQECAQSLDNWLWITFTRSNPAQDIWGVHEKINHKHWSCQAPLVVDARIKAHHAPALVENAEVSLKADAWIAKYLCEPLGSANAKN